ncbi:MAG TPA: hypothetical protein VFB23_11445 [Candidatus Acidoferrales bacterium]|nr:hypothetical protein [Candidatus Acidoferrales bacterium]
MKIREYRFAKDLIVDALRTGAEHRIRITEGLPADAKIFAIAPLPSGEISVLIHSETFESTPTEVLPSGRGVAPSKPFPIHTIVVQRL